MYTFSTISQGHLNTCHPLLVKLFKTVILYQDCSVICGRRGMEEQSIAFARGNSKLEWPKSKHNAHQSLAADVMKYPVVWDDFTSNASNENT